MGCPRISVIYPAFITVFVRVSIRAFNTCATAAGGTGLTNQVIIELLTRW